MVGAAVSRGRQTLEPAVIYFKLRRATDRVRFARTFFFSSFFFLSWMGCSVSDIARWQKKEDVSLCP